VKDFVKMKRNSVKAGSGIGRDLRLILAGLIFLPGMAVGATAAELKVSALLDPAEITQGQEAVLRISVAGASKAKLQVPEVEGLKISYAGQNTSIQIVNFNRSDTVTYTFRVTGFKPGNYTIPAFSVEAEGMNKQTQELALTILKSSGPDTAGEPDGSGKEEKIKVEPREMNQTYFLQMDLKDERLYVGQMVPVTFRLFIRVGYEFGPKSLPELNSEAFILGTLSNRPQQYQVSLNGTPYHVLIWNTAMTAVKAGDYDLELSQKGEVPDRDRVIGGGSSLFEQLMNRGGQVKPVELKSKAMKVSVMPLPQENKPKSFSGAIGSFTFVGQASPVELTAGDPMELTVAIEGSGNFDRIDWPGMEQNRFWRSYPPNSSFKATDEAGIEGRKTYKQALIPLVSEIKEIPMQEFSYFDPVTGQYKILRSDPLALTIRAAADSAFPGGGGLPSLVPDVTSGQDTLGLLPNRLNPGRTGQSVQPWTSESWFHVALAVPVLLFLGIGASVLFVYARRRWWGGDGGREMDRLLAREIQVMQSSLQQADSDTFVKSARRVLQQALAREWQCPPDSVTRHEVRQRQPGGVQDLENLFAALDAVDYSGASLSGEEMNDLHGGIQSWLLSRGKGGSRV